MSEGKFYRPEGASGFDTSAGGLGVQPAWLSPLESGRAEPAGSIIMHCGDEAPIGYLLCDGSEVSRKTYSRLFNVTGTRFGAGDGATTFNVPDMRGRAPICVVPSGLPEVDQIGDNEGLPQWERSSLHGHSGGSGLTATHSLTLPDHRHVHVSRNGAANDNTDFHSGLSTDGSTGGGSAANPITQTAGQIASAPAIPGSISISGTIGPGGTRPVDTPAYMVLNFIVRT